VQQLQASIKADEAQIETARVFFSLAHFFSLFLVFSAGSVMPRIYRLVWKFSMNNFRDKVLEMMAGRAL